MLSLPATVPGQWVMSGNITTLTLAVVSWWRGGWMVGWYNLIITVLCRDCSMDSRFTGHKVTPGRMKILHRKILKGECTN